MWRKVVGLGSGLIVLAGCSSSWLPNMDLRLPSGGPSTMDLRVDSEPAGAEAKASVGGPSCRTPCVLPVATRGDFTVTFTREGFLPQTIPVQVVRPTDLRADPEGPSDGPSLSPNPLVAELQPAPPPARKRNAKSRKRPAAPPPEQAPALR